MPITTEALGELSALFGEFDELIDNVKGREGAANWLADDEATVLDETFECEIDGDNGFQVVQDAEFLDFFTGNLDHNGDEVSVSLGVHQVMLLRDLCNQFLVLPGNAAAVKELEGLL